MRKYCIRQLNLAAALIGFLPFVGLSMVFSLLARLSGNRDNPRLVWGATPIISNKYWSNAMRRAGYQSQTLMLTFYSRINEKNDFDEYVFDHFGSWMPSYIKRILIFWQTFFRFDVFFLSCDGWLLGSTPYWRLEGFFLKLAGKKIVMMPYGGDSYSYRNVRSTALIHALMLSYPGASLQQEKKEAKVRYWTRAADAVITGLEGPDGFGRWDALVPSHLHIDTGQWQSSTRRNMANGVDGVVTIAHAPNHTGFKGTEFIVHAVEKLRERGLKVELLLLQNIKNSEVKRILETQADILVEQIIATGYALNAIEGMASGLPVLSNLDDDVYMLPHRRWSFLGECPILSTSPETIIEHLEQLVRRPELRLELGMASRKYVDKYHSLDAAVELYGSAVDYVYGRLSGADLLNLYHPLLGKHPYASRIVHPLEQSHLKP